MKPRIFIVFPTSSLKTLLLMDAFGSLHTDAQSGSPLCVMLMLTPYLFSSETYSLLQYWHPRSEWWMSRLEISMSIVESAIRRASSGYFVSSVGPTAQPTILWE